MLHLYGKSILGVWEAHWDAGWRLARAFAPPVVDFRAMSLIEAMNTIGSRALKEDSMAFGRALHMAINALKSGAKLTEEQAAAWASSMSNISNLRDLAHFALSGGFAVN